LEESRLAVVKMVGHCVEPVFDLVEVVHGMENGDGLHPIEVHRNNYTELLAAAVSQIRRVTDSQATEIFTVVRSDIVIGHVMRLNCGPVKL
jgi:predicted Zn-dependent protease